TRVRWPRGCVPRWSGSSPARPGTPAEAPAHGAPADAPGPDRPLTRRRTAPADLLGHAEFVALRVGEGDPAVRALPPVGREGRAPPDQLLDPRRDVVGAGPDIKVHPVLGRLRLGYELEQHPWRPLKPIGVPDRRPRLPDQQPVVRLGVLLACVALG